MTRIDDLIAELAPGGVARARLGDIASLVRGNGMPKADLRAEGVGAIHYGQIYTHYGVSATETISFVEPTAATRLVKVEPGDLVITNTSENVADIGKAVAWLGAETIVTGGHATVIKHQQDATFLSHWFRSESFQRQKRALASGTKVIDVSARQLAGVLVPVPPIAVQNEIARVLSLYSALEAELEAELEARRTQYSYFRDQLVSRNRAGAFRRVRLRDVGALIRGRRFVKADMVEAGIPAIHYGEIYTHYGASAFTARSQVREELRPSLRFAHPGDVVIAAVGETVEDVAKAVAWVGNEPVAIHDDTFLLRGEFDSKFVSYALQTADFHQQKKKHVARAKVKRLSAAGIAQIEIPMPSYDEQVRIVASVEKFDEIANSMSGGLPAELRARRQQLAQYRDRLLAFDGST